MNNWPISQPASTNATMHRVLKKAEKLNISYPKNMYEYNGEG